MFRNDKANGNRRIITEMNNDVNPHNDTNGNHRDTIPFSKKKSGSNIG